MACGSLAAGGCDFDIHHTGPCSQNTDKLPCEGCAMPVQPTWWHPSGGLCVDCLVDHAMPLHTIQTGRSAGAGHEPGSSPGRSTPSTEGNQAPVSDGEQKGAP